MVYLELLHILDEENSLQHLLSHMRNVTNQELSLPEADATFEELKEKELALSNLDSPLRKHSYMFRI